MTRILWPLFSGQNVMYSAIKQDVPLLPDSVVLLLHDAHQFNYLYLYTKRESCNALECSGGARTWIGMCRRRRPAGLCQCTGLARTTHGLGAAERLVLSN